MNKVTSFNAYYNCQNILYVSGSMTVDDESTSPTLVARDTQNDDTLEVDLIMGTQQYPKNTKALIKLLNQIPVGGYTGTQTSVNLLLNNVLIATATIRPEVVITLDV